MGCRLTLALVVGIAIGLALSHRSQSVTVYPILLCPEGCAYDTSSGHTYKRQVLSLGKEVYTAIPEGQQVVRQSGSLIESLSQDNHKCLVADAQNWNCESGLG
jgi:hypothetical protein